MAVLEMAAELDPGAWLVAHRFEMERGESTWLAALGDFDAQGRWALDGQLSCAEWLMWSTKMARATAYEKLRIARQLRVRPVLGDAFGDGRLSYSALRAITRIDGPDPDTDLALVDLAVASSVADVERAVRAYQLHAEQHRRPSDALERRGVRVIRGFDGCGRVEITLSDVEIEEFALTLQAFVDGGRRPSPPESPRGDSAPDPDPDPDPEPDPEPDPDPASQSSAGDSRRCRADAFMDMVGVGLAHLDGPRPGGDDRYVLHVVTTSENAVELLDGTALDAATSARLSCDSATVTHVQSIDGEPLALGRKTRVWSTAQRRAALVRDGGHCRFPGCSRRVADLHHQRGWAKGGPTDLSNGFLVCPRHHTLLHDGYLAEGNPNGTLSFARPDGIHIGSTTPVVRVHQPPVEPE